MNEERVILLQNQYDDEKQRNHDLQIKLNETSKMKIKLECQLNDLKHKNNETITNKSAQIKLKEENIVDLKNKLTKIQSKFDDETIKNELTVKQLQDDLETTSKLKIQSKF